MDPIFQNDNSMHIRTEASLNSPQENSTSIDYEKQEKSMYAMPQKIPFADLNQDLNLVPKQETQQYYPFMFQDSPNYMKFEKENYLKEDRV